jgi:hypothetical protein
MLNLSKNYYIKKIAFHPYFDSWLFLGLRLLNLEELKKYYKDLDRNYKLDKILNIVENVIWILIIICSFYLLKLLLFI